MITQAKFAPQYVVEPHAIFWRPLNYFTPVTREGEDGLDKFEAASFNIGNNISFDLRKYRGYPKYTSTLYLSESIIDLDEILSTVSLIINEMYIPKLSLGWRRGWKFEPGVLVRNKKDRLSESEARVLTLKIAASQPNHVATTDFIKKQVRGFYKFSEIDMLPSNTRRNEQRWQQIVGNVVSHRSTPSGPFQKGFAERTADGLQVTALGIAYLKSIGFSV